MTDTVNESLCDTNRLRDIKNERQNVEEQVSG